MAGDASVSKRTDEVLVALGEQQPAADDERADQLGGEADVAAKARILVPSMLSASATASMISAQMMVEPVPGVKLEQQREVRARRRRRRRRW